MVRVKTQNNGSLTVTFLCFFFFLLVVKYLNGKLDDDTKYAVFQRSFHSDNDYENEGFIIFTTNKNNTAAVVAGVVVSLIVVAVIVVVVVLYIRRRKRDKAADGENMPMNSESPRTTRTKSVTEIFRKSGIGELFFRKVAKRSFGIRDFPHLKHGIPGPDSDFKRKSGQDFGLKVYTEGGIPKLIYNHRNYGIAKKFSSRSWY